MDRINPEGVRIDELPFVLRQRRLVLIARNIDSCLLCRRPRVNDAGLCDPCYSLLDGEALQLAVNWMSGRGP